MKDSYQEFIDYFHISKKDLFDFGIQSLILADLSVAKNQYSNIITNLQNNSRLTIRSYGRNGSNSDLFINLYNYLFRNSNIIVDPTNNAIPRKNISSATGYKINKNLYNYQISHIWGKTKNPILFESVWNICFTPRIIDPFTGHECKCGWNDDFIPILKRFVYDRFEDIIIDYNKFVTSQNLDKKIKEFSKELRACSSYNPQLIDRFELDALSEWELIKKP